MSAVLLFGSILFSCSNENGELVGVQDREEWYQEDPVGMLFIPMGAYNMGDADQDVPYAQVSPSRTVSVQAFYMDETEITNNEYRQFVFWVRDSIAHTILGNQDNPELGEHYQVDESGQVIEFGQQNPYKLINWEEEIDYSDEKINEVLEDPMEEFYLLEDQRYYHIKQVNTWRLLFKYYWINYKAAARKAGRYTSNDAVKNGGKGNNRKQFIMERTDAVYPDTLVWSHDYTYSFNEPMTQNYFWHPAYDNYPVVGVSWIQARAFSIWRTGLKRSYDMQEGTAFWNDFRLPSESEWEWAARGGLDLNPYPWGGPYVRNSNGCFLANYKPLRGNYVDDGGFHTLIVGHYAPNDYGLYDMAGNVAEWCDDSYDEAAYRFAHDLNMQYSRDANDEVTTVDSRRVIRGGSWKDIGYYIRTSTRTYEYQDTAKCYIGFRNVQTYLGRSKGDGPSSSNVYN